MTTLSQRYALALASESLFENNVINELQKLLLITKKYEEEDDEFTWCLEIDKVSYQIMLRKRRLTILKYDIPIYSRQLSDYDQMRFFNNVHPNDDKVNIGTKALSYIYTTYNGNMIMTDKFLGVRNKNDSLVASVTCLSFVDVSDTIILKSMTVMVDIEGVACFNCSTSAKFNLTHAILAPYLATVKENVNSFNFKNTTHIRCGVRELFICYLNDMWILSLIRRMNNNSVKIQTRTSTNLTFNYVAEFDETSAIVLDGEFDQTDMNSLVVVFDRNTAIQITGGGQLQKSFFSNLSPCSAVYIAV